MILLTRLSGSAFALNSELIERVDSTPDTVITLIDGSKYVVAEGLHAVINAIRHHRAEVIALSAHVQVGEVDVWPDDDRVSPEAARTRQDVPPPADSVPRLASVTPHPSLHVHENRSEGKF
ncbi:flagellar FlbD family protein [Nocardioides psychrotolerans]|uniref:Flagellar protein FlbD n=1 Tax=Nocardioides psychrotolerans TaxID=1005945 RepID=A0A1I3Q5A6_9ACTN|nr:flagellar FlbD family protein [Nocardioides psychrotolerans]SFJ29143.1 flagellar protein FlbD [Nocardioides psychrotolerans]